MGNINRQKPGTVIAGRSAGGEFAPTTRGEATFNPDTITHAEAPLTPESVMEHLESFDLDYGNAEAFLQDGDVYFSMEGPNHATMSSRLPVDGGKEMLEDLIIERADDFDPEERFEEIWSDEFAKHNGFTAFQFADMLKEDKQHFMQVAEKLETRKENRAVSTNILNLLQHSHDTDPSPYKIDGWDARAAYPQLAQLEKDGTCDDPAAARDEFDGIFGDQDEDENDIEQYPGGRHMMALWERIEEEANQA